MAYHPGLFFMDLRLRELLGYESLKRFVEVSIELAPAGLGFDRDPLPELAGIVASLVEKAIDHHDVDEEVVHAARLLADYDGRWQYLLDKSEAAAAASN